MLPPMAPPMMPPMAGPSAGGTGGREGERRRWPDENPVRSTQIVIQPLDGGRLATFDPETGSLRAAAGAAGPVGGVLGYFGEVLAVFYRKAGRLTLRLGPNEFDLDAPAVDVAWAQLGPQQARFLVRVEGELIVDFPYPINGGGTDFGLLIRDILADPRQCVGVFN